MKSFSLKTQTIHIIEVITESYLDQFHQEKERSRKDVGLEIYNQSNHLVKNNSDNVFNDYRLTHFDSVIVFRNHSSNNELVNRKFIDDELNKDSFLRFNQTLQN